MGPRPLKRFRAFFGALAMFCISLSEAAHGAEPLPGPGICRQAGLQLGRTDGAYVAACQTKSERQGALWRNLLVEDQAGHIASIGSVPVTNEFGEAHLVTDRYRRQWYVLFEREETGDSAEIAATMTIYSLSPSMLLKTSPAIDFDIRDLGDDGLFEIVVYKETEPSRLDFPLGWPEVVELRETLKVGELSRYPIVLSEFIEKARAVIASAKDDCSDMREQGERECIYEADIALMERRILIAQGLSAARQ